MKTVILCGSRSREGQTARAVGAFISGLTGQFYRQFALTIAASTIISAINAMTRNTIASRSMMAISVKERFRTHA